MKRKVILFAVVLCAILLSLIALSYKRQSIDTFHQHLSTPAFSPENADGTFRTHLPILSIDSPDIGSLVVEHDGATVASQITVRDGGEGNNSLDTQVMLETDAHIRYRGNSSLHFDKKSYRLKLVDSDGLPAVHSMMGMPKSDEWVLNGPFLDKSLMRNYMLMNISNQACAAAPDVRYCELFINGEYRGLYIMMQSVTRSLVGLEKNNSERAECSYIVRLDRGGTIPLEPFSSYALLTKSSFNLVYPTFKTATPEQIEFVEHDLSAFEKSLYSLDYNDSFLGYPSHINTSSFIDYFILNEFFQNYDATRYSTYLYKPYGGKLSIGPVWDFNNALDNYIETAYDATGFELPISIWYKMLFKDPDFVSSVISRYHTLRSSYLSEQYLMDYIDSTAAWLGDAIARNFDVWGYTLLPENNLLIPDERAITSYEQAIKQMKDFLIRRGNWLDENIDLLNQYCHPSATKQYQH